MDEAGFRSYLKRLGKQPHVIDSLVGGVMRFELYLLENCHKELLEASEQDIRDFASVIGKQIRGVAFYYRFSGYNDLAGFASKLREQEVAKNRKAFRLCDFRGIDPELVKRLEDCGIASVTQMLEAGKTPADRQRLAEAISRPEIDILKLVKLSDLARLKGVKGIRARLYYDAGYQSPEQIAACEPEELQLSLEKFVKESGFDGTPPLPKEVLHTIQAARRLPPLVEY